jgi:hypothetical protein
VKTIAQYKKEGAKKIFSSCTGPHAARVEKHAIGSIVEVVNPRKVVVIVVDCDMPFGTLQPSPRLSHFGSKIINPSKVVVNVVDCDAPFGTVQLSPRLSLLWRLNASIATLALDIAIHSK